MEDEDDRPLRPLRQLDAIALASLTQRVLSLEGRVDSGFKQLDGRLDRLRFVDVDVYRANQETADQTHRALAEANARLAETIKSVNDSLERSIATLRADTDKRIGRVDTRATWSQAGIGLIVLGAVVAMILRIGMGIG